MTGIYGPTVWILTMLIGEFTEYLVKASYMVSQVASGSPPALNLTTDTSMILLLFPL